MQYNVTPFVCGDTLTFYAQTSDPSSDGDAADAASPPAYRIYRGENGTPVATGTMSLLDDANTIGFYSEAIPITGYAPGTYCIRLTASVGTSDGAGLAGFIVGGAGPLVVRTTIATLASQTSFTLTAGPAENSALLHHMVIIRDAASVDQFAIGYISAYTGSTKTVTLAADPGIFTMAVGDFVEVWGPVSSNMTKHGGTAYTAGAIPSAVAGANGGLPTVDGNNRVAGIVGTITTLDALDTAQDTQHSTTQTAIADLPTNAELATALGTADDAVLAAIAALNNISTAQVNAEVDTALADVGLTTTITGRIDAAVSTRATPAQILTTQLTEAYAADGAAPTVTQALMLIQQALTEVAINSTTMTIKKLDGSTTAATLTLNDATTPTSKTRAT